MSADNPTAGTPAEAARATAALRVELAVAASDALTKLEATYDMQRPDVGAYDSGCLALAVDRLLAELRKQRPR